MSKRDINFCIKEVLNNHAGGRKTHKVLTQMYVRKGKQEHFEIKTQTLSSSHRPLFGRNFYHKPRRTFGSLMVEANDHDAQVICRKIGHGVV